MNSKNLTCPHCGVNICADFEIGVINVKNSSYSFYFQTALCPSCEKPIIYMENGYNKCNDCYEEIFVTTEELRLIYPDYVFISKLSEEIPEKYSKDYYEAQRIKDLSPKSSATLCRYILQKLLHEEFNIKEKDLHIEIKKLEEQNKIPNQLCQMLQAFRKVANIGAHPKKGTNPNEIVEIEPGEAEIMLELLKRLFDYVFVDPKKDEKILEEWKEKYNI